MSWFFFSLQTRRENRSVWSPRDIIQTLKVPLQTATVGPGGVEILVVIGLLKFLEGKNLLTNEELLFRLIHIFYLFYN